MSLHVLVVEDDRGFRAVLARYLDRRGDTVLEAGSLAEARAHLENASVDVVLADIGLPDGLGLDLAESEVPPVILMTADGTVENAVSAMHLGVIDFLLKPFDFEQLEAALGRVSGEERAGAPAPRASARPSGAPRSEPADRDLEAFRARYAPSILGSAPRLMRVFDILERIRDTDCSVLVTGESGTGKELVARAIHLSSDRADGPFVAVNCAAIPENLLESDQVWPLRGAFTGATASRTGRFAAAHQGTLFLDEIGELPVALQAKLLRAIQEKEITPVGDSRSQKVDVRIVTATNRDLEDMVTAGRFREDLLYRLNVIPIELPALRERRSDVPTLVARFVERTNERRGRSITGVTEAAMRSLTAYEWPGNVRELENTVERMVVLRTRGEIDVEDLPRNVRGTATAAHGASDDPMLPDEGIDLKDAVERYENALILQALERTGWNKNQAAAILRMNRTTLVEKLKKKQLAA